MAPHSSQQESEADQHSCSSYEGFVTREGCAVCLSPRPGASVGKHGGKHSMPILVLTCCVRVTQDCSPSQEHGEANETTRHS